IALIGMPSCGKTTLGRLLAKSLGRTFVDLDEEIVKTDGRSIPLNITFTSSWWATPPPMRPPRCCASLTAPAVPCGC
ncbi:shikimate kinase, partial [Faecalibacterium wellingii]|uniref:shikimate kinase n=1 Tax=Faecalibacterium wellingii TaxID=2929491 RepID=UPI003ED97BF7